MKGTTIGLGLFSLVAGLVVLSGCGQPPAPTVNTAKTDRHDAAEHGHAPGVIAMGDYHAKILIEKGGQLKLFIFGKDEHKVATIEAQEVQGHLRVENGTEAEVVKLKPDPQPGDGKGKTSQFVGQVPETLVGKPLIATLRLNIAGEAYRPEFHWAIGGKHHSPDDHAQMPEGLKRGDGVSDEEREHYLTPGGIYTAADIAANGNVVPSEKFKGVRFKHGKAKAGDKICPVTDNLADPQCTWIVAGKTYEFCCPPCLDRFIDMAKHEPETIKAPGEYIKQ